MRLYMWNSQGAKWDDLWTNWVNPALAAYPKEDVLGLLVESGWPPYIRTGDVTLNQEYVYPLQRSTLLDANGAAASPLCQAVDAKRGRHAYWVPWVYSIDNKTNTRCSMGGLWIPQSGRVTQVTRFNFETQARPTIRVVVGKSTGAELTLLQVHLISGYPNYALQQLNELMSSVPELIFPGTAALILGDLNIDLLTYPITVDKPWRILRTNQATQQKGGELDWGMLYDPNKAFSGASANFVVSWKTPTNGSDHAVIRYDLPLS